MLLTFMSTNHDKFASSVELKVVVLIDKLEVNKTTFGDVNIKKGNVLF